MARIGARQLVEKERDKILNAKSRKTRLIGQRMTKEEEHKANMNVPVSVSWRTEVPDARVKNS